MTSTETIKSALPHASDGESASLRRASPRALRLAYLTTAYPEVSHTFIRSEILELERRGHRIVRIAVRPSSSDLQDPADLAEAEKTHCILKRGPVRLAAAAMWTMLTRPLSMVRALVMTLRMNRFSDRGLIRHLAYLIEACWLLRFLRHRGVEHLHVHFGTNASAVARLVRRLGGPGYSMTVHGPDELDSPRGLSLGAKIEDSDFVVAISDYCGAQLRRWVDYPSWEKIKIVHCTVDSAYAEDPQPIRSDSRTLVCVGRLSQQKGHLVLLDAVAELVDEGADVKLVLVGDGEMRPMLEKAISDRGLDEHVHVTGWASGAKVREHIRDCRAMVLPSFAEGLPVVIMEALALGRPVISTYIAGIPELVRPGENGWLVPAGNVKQLAEAIRQVLLTPTEKLDAMGEAGRRLVLRNHSLDREMDKLESLFAGFCDSADRSCGQ